MDKNNAVTSIFVLDAIEQLTLGESQLVTEVLSNMDWTATPNHAVVDKDALKSELKAYLTHKSHESLGNLVGMAFSVNPVITFLANDGCTLEELQGVKIEGFDREPQDYVIHQGALYRRSETPDAFNDGDWYFDSTTFSDAFVTALWRSKLTTDEIWVHLRCPCNLKDVSGW